MLSDAAGEDECIQTAERGDAAAEQRDEPVLVDIECERCDRVTGVRALDNRTHIR